MRFGDVSAFCDDCRTARTHRVVDDRDEDTVELRCLCCGGGGKWPKGSVGIRTVEEVAGGERLGDVVPR